MRGAVRRAAQPHAVAGVDKDLEVAFGDGRRFGARAGTPLVRCPTAPADVACPA
ncbi:hypothetical protein [Microbispora sp. H10885]|uniref:hypothetical protein n=1 Tax=Microbispora sp. H10885 TaxID=2729110 RepID=UPI001601C650|nr:hypothetical protein [Microbispora sp. H10885]